MSSPTIRANQTCNRGEILHRRVPCGRQPLPANAVLCEPHSEYGYMVGTQGHVNCQKRPTLRGSDFWDNRYLVSCNFQFSKQKWAADSRTRESPIKPYRPRAIDDLHASRNNQGAAHLGVTCGLEQAPGLRHGEWR